jgi:hypothetical protein
MRALSWSRSGQLRSQLNSLGPPRQQFRYEVPSPLGQEEPFQLQRLSDQEAPIPAVRGVLESQSQQGAVLSDWLIAP